jgi:hypothetical protein
MGNYLVPGTLELQTTTTENEEANAKAFEGMQIGSDPVEPKQEQFDDCNGPLDVMSETENPTSGILPSNMETMEVSLPRLSRSQEGGRSLEDVYTYEFPEGAFVNLEAHLRISEGERHRQVAVLGMEHHIDHSLVHHPNCLCHDDESGDDSPT